MFGNSRLDHIDGLRFIAVSIVILYHFNFSLFSGGYVGVDVFFVISGFLISRQLCCQIEDGRFKFKDFYIRRLRRLLPALFFTIIVVVIGSLLLFANYDLKRLGGAIVSAMFSVSNLYFWREVGYWDASAELKPLLHTWSLSVEEQFYVVWPIVFFLALNNGNRSRLFIAILLLFCGSLIFSEFSYTTLPKKKYFLLPFRIFEMAFGGLLLFIPPKFAKINELSSSLLCAVGYGLILVPTIIFEGNLNFPGVLSFIPCLGAGLLIIYGNKGHINSFLHWPLIRKIGLISYSLYLIHWPLFVFYKYNVIRPLYFYEKALLILISILVAQFMYTFIENRFRLSSNTSIRNTSNIRFFVYVSPIVLSLTLLGYSYKYNPDAWSWRLPPDIESPLFNQKISEMKNCLECHKDNYLFIGDSHVNRAKRWLSLLTKDSSSSSRWIGPYFPVIKKYKSEYGRQYTSNDSVKKVRELIKSRRQNIVFVAHWTNVLKGDKFRMSENIQEFLDIFKATLVSAKSSGKNVYVIGSMPYYATNTRVCTGRPFPPSYCKNFMKPIHFDQQKEFNQLLKQKTSSAGAKYLDIFSHLCKADSCRIIYDSKSLYDDSEHLSSYNLGGFLLKDRKQLKLHDFFL